MIRFYILQQCFHKLGTLICGCTFRSQQKALHRRLAYNICYRHNPWLLRLCSFEQYSDNSSILAYTCITYGQPSRMAHQFYHSAMLPIWPSRQFCALVPELSSFFHRRANTSCNQRLHICDYNQTSSTMDKTGISSHIKLA